MNMQESVIARDARISHDLDVEQNEEFFNWPWQWKDLFIEYRDMGYPSAKELYEECPYYSYRHTVRLVENVFFPMACKYGI